MASKGSRGSLEDGGQPSSRSEDSISFTFDGATFLTNRLEEILELADADISKVSEVSASYCSLKGIGRLNTLRGLTRLSIDHTDIGSIDQLPAFEHLEYLNICSTRIKSIKSIEKFPRLKSLNLRSTAVTDISPVGKLKSLVDLDLCSTQIKSTKALASLIQLKRLMLHRCAIEAIDELSNLKHLEELDIGNTEVSNIRPLAKATKLAKLNLCNTPISDLTPLSRASALTWLNLEGTKVSDLSPISGLNNLAEAAVAKPPIAGLFFDQCVNLKDPVLIGYSTLGNPEKTQKTIKYLNELKSNIQETSNPEHSIGNPSTNRSGALPAIPEPGPGLWFSMSANGAVSLSPADELDKAGNNVERLSLLHPLLVQTAQDLLSALRSSGNSHPDLVSRVKSYAALISTDLHQIPIHQLLYEGIRLQGALTAASRSGVDRLEPMVEDVAYEALESLCSIHGMFILNTKLGNELLEQSRLYAQPDLSNLAHTIAATELCEDLINHPELVDAQAAAALLEVANYSETGPYGERAATFKRTSFRNLIGLMTIMAVLTVISVSNIPAGVIAAFALCLLDKTEWAKNTIAPYAKAVEDRVKGLGPLFGDKLRQFMLKRKNLLIRILGEQAYTSWLGRYLNALKDEDQDSE